MHELQIDKSLQKKPLFKTTKNEILNPSQEYKFAKKTIRVGINNSYTCDCNFNYWSLVE